MTIHEQERETLPDKICAVAAEEQGRYSAGCEEVLRALLGTEYKIYGAGKGKNQNNM